MVQKYKKNTKYFFESKKSCTFAPAFRRNRWQEVSRGLLCCVGTIQQFNYTQSLSLTKLSRVLRSVSSSIVV